MAFSFLTWEKIDKISKFYIEALPAAAYNQKVIDALMEVRNNIISANQSNQWQNIVCSF